MIYTDKKLIFADLTYKVRGAIFAVYNELGFGHKENVYQKALSKELAAFFENNFALLTNIVTLWYCVI